MDADPAQQIATLFDTQDAVLVAQAVSVLKSVHITPTELLNHWQKQAETSSQAALTVESLNALHTQLLSARPPPTVNARAKPSMNSLLGEIITTPAKKPTARTGSSLSKPPPSSSPHGPQATPLQYNGQRPIASIPSRLKSSPAQGVSSMQPYSTSSPASSASTATTSTATPFPMRLTPFKLQESLNQHLPLLTAEQKRTGARGVAGAGSTKISLASTTDPKSYNYRYMYERMMERSEMLDGLIDEAAEVFKVHYGLEDFDDPSNQSQEDIVAVGRLCSAPATSATPASQKLTDSTTFLETSRTLGNGSRILLRFDADMKLHGATKGSGGVGLFSGGLVAVRGKNGGGKVFGVSEIYLMPPPDPTFTRPSALLEYQYGQGPRQAKGEPLAVIVAAGPYTLDTDLDYLPLRELIKRVVEVEKCDVLILLGPFIDASHPLIVSGAVDHSPAELFRAKISSGLQKIMEGSPGTTVILVPNGRDMTSAHVAYPQSPLARDRELALPKGVKLLPNPTTFSINEVVFSINSVDVLFHLRNQEMFQKGVEVTDESSGAAQPGAKDALARACRHILTQRSFYPLFPVPTGPGLDSLNLDMTHYNLVKMAPAGAADIIILPSMLKHFTKVVDSTVFLNPSFLTRGGSAGTFARLTIHPLDEQELQRRAVEASGMTAGVEGEIDEEIEHRLWERIRVDMIKI